MNNIDLAKLWSEYGDAILGFGAQAVGALIVLIIALALAVTLIQLSLAWLGIGIGFGVIFAIWAMRTGFGTGSSEPIASPRLRQRMADRRRQARWNRKQANEDDDG